MHQNTTWPASHFYLLLHWLSQLRLLLFPAAALYHIQLKEQELFGCLTITSHQRNEVYLSTKMENLMFGPLNQKLRLKQNQPRRRQRMLLWLGLEELPLLLLQQ